MNLEDFKTLTVYAPENWFHNTGCQYPLVCPPGTEVEFKEVVKNYFGTWYRVKYKDETYYIAPEYCQGNVIVKIWHKDIFIAEANRNIRIYFCEDRYGKEYKVNSETGELEEI